MSDYFVNKYTFKKNKSCIEGAVQRYVQIRSKDELRLRELSEIYDYIRNEHHDIEAMCNALRLVHSAPHHVDVLLITKKLFYSVTEKGTIPEQMQFFYTLDKLNLMRHQTQ